MLTFASDAFSATDCCWASTSMHHCGELHAPYADVPLLRRHAVDPQAPALPYAGHGLTRLRFLRPDTRLYGSFFGWPLLGSKHVVRLPSPMCAVAAGRRAPSLQRSGQALSHACAAPGALSTASTKTAEAPGAPSTASARTAEDAAIPAALLPLTCAATVGIVALAKKTSVATEATLSQESAANSSVCRRHLASQQWEVVTRLDLPSSGVLLAGNLRALLTLRLQLGAYEIARSYVALDAVPGAGCGGRPLPQLSVSEDH
eukprot:NODE_6057_length_1710_cov_3.259634.p2 GENE.NODE_6057_length_1710_cov_3.259634~~NODE_6057_length_1710_cov_3.259634.p2  ORF type:complete len:260 (-),score=43.79 NODE_6057_length_1710_cov_3.259634:67-846(-)